MIGTTVSHYRIVEKLGGNMGEVYLADDTALPRKVVIKFLPSGFGAAERERFRREAEAASTLKHPNIVTIHDVGTHEGRPYIVMEHVDGEPLSRMIEGGDLTVERVLTIAIQIFEGLEAAHEAGIVHRDVKPDNIVVDRGARVRILDFGLAKLRGAMSLTEENLTPGTVRYMSPEQARGAAVDARSDLFSAGIVVYELLARRHPFEGEHPQAVLYAITTQDPQPLRRYNHRLTDGIERVVATLLAKDPEERYPAAKAVLIDLRRELRAAKGRPGAGAWHPRRGAWIGAGAGLVAVIAAAWFFGRAPDRRPSENASSRPAAVAQFNSIAVLPFVDMSPGKDQEYFSDGLSEELTNVLVKIPDLKVTGHTSAFSFKGKSEDLRAIGEKLGVAHILDGSVRKSGERIRITVQLVKTADGFHIWSKSYDRTLDDVFAVQDDIAASVARELRVTLLSNSAGGSSPDAAAYDLVLQARFVLQNRNPQTIPEGLALLQRALVLAPDYAPAWAEMGFVYQRQYERGEPAEASRLNDQARRALARALELDPGLAVAHSRMANVQRRDWDFAAAERSMQRALELDPNHPVVLGNAAYLRWIMGKPGEAIVLEKRRLEIDPLSLNGYDTLADLYLAAGRIDDAEACLHELEELAPDFPTGSMGYVHLLRGDTEKARAAFDRIQKLDGPGDNARFFVDAIVEHTAGHVEASASAAAEFEKRLGAENPLGCARIRAWRGEADAAFAWLDGAFARHDPALHTIKTDLLLRPLHADPRWNALLERIGLPRE